MFRLPAILIGLLLIPTISVAQTTYTTPKTWMVTSPVDSVSAIKSKQSFATGFVSSETNSLGTFSEGSSISFLDPQGDIYLDSRTALFGGHRDHDDVFVKIVGSAYGSGDLGGAIFSIFDTNGPEGWGRNGYGNDDGGDMSIVVNPVPPRIAVGQDIKNDDGISRTVTLSATGAVIKPALSNTQLELYRPWMRVYTNWEAGAPSKGSDGTGVVRPSVYFGYISAITNTATETDISIAYNSNGDRLAGWRTANSDARVTSAPGTNTGDQLDYLSPDPVWKYTHTALFIGMANKKFGYNLVVACGKQDTPGQADDAVTRECQAGEIDLRNVGTVDHRWEIQGPAISYGGSVRGTANSYDLDLAGGNENLLVLQGEWWSTAIRSSPIYIPGYDGPANTAGSIKPYFTMSMSTAEGWGADSKDTYPWISLASWNVRNTIANGIGSYSDFTTHIGILINTPDGTISGSPQEHIELNPNSYHNGIGLCAYSESDRTCGLIVDGDGKTRFSEDTYFGAGKWIYLTDSNGVHEGAIYSDGTNPIVLDASSGSSNSTQAVYVKGSLHVANDTTVLGVAFTVPNGYITAGSYIKSSAYVAAGVYTKATLPSSIEDGGTVFCSDCKLNGVAGIPVYYHTATSTWLDSQNNALTN